MEATIAVGNLIKERERERERVGILATKIGERCGKADVMECVKGPERVGWKNIKNKGLDGGFKKKPMRRPLFPFFFF